MKPVMVTRPGGTAGKATGDRAVTSSPATSVATHGPAPGWLAALEAKVKGQPGHLAPGSNPAVLPGPVLIAPPQRFGSPTGMFPMTNSDWLMTEINGCHCRQLIGNAKDAGI